MVDIGRGQAPAAVRSVGTEQSSYVDWPAIFAGTLLATAIAFVLNTFGAAIGLSVVSPFDNEGIGGLGLLIAVALWLIWVTVSSFMAGAYISGRLRRRINDATEHEVDIRDGVHGLVVWALGIVLSALLLASGASVVVTAGAEAIAGSQASENGDSPATGPAYDRALSRLFRPSPDAAAAQPGTAPADRAALREEFKGLLQGSAESGDIAAEDKAYMASVVAAETGLDQQQATGRVEQFAGQVREQRSKAEEAAETARKASVVGAFVLAAALFIAGAGAWWAAGLGGQHRDEQTMIRFFVRRK